MQINSKVMATCTMFAEYTSRLSRYLAAAEAEANGTATTDTTHAHDVSQLPADLTEVAGASHPQSQQNANTNTAKLDKLIDVLSRYEDNFSRHLKILMDALNYLAATETVVFLSLCARLSMAGEGPIGAGGGEGRTAR